MRPTTKTPSFILTYKIWWDKAYLFILFSVTFYYWYLLLHLQTLPCQHNVSQAAQEAQACDYSIILWDKEQNNHFLFLFLFFWNEEKMFYGGKSNGCRWSGKICRIAPPPLAIRCQVTLSFCPVDSTWRTGTHIA